MAKPGAVINNTSADEVSNQALFAASKARFALVSTDSTVGGGGVGAAGVVTVVPADSGAAGVSAFGSAEASAFGVSLLGVSAGWVSWPKAKLVNRTNKA